MESGSIKALSKYRYEKALSNLALAQTLLDAEEYGFAQNRAYYSAFDAMRAINALDEFDSSKHSGVIAHFNKEYVKTKIFPASSSSIIRKASMLREKSDYEDFYEPEKEETEETIEKVAIFLHDVGYYLRKKCVIE